tara:strand:- start:2217 stop:3191 length:975 start_codon:yes stop_codon:yes gene_type:complete
MLKQFNPFTNTSTSSSSSEDGKVYCSLKQLMDLRWTVQSIKLPKTKKISRPQTGSHLSKFRGRGMEFSEVRVYQPGDDVRSIDWRVTARRQTPHTKLFNEERERPLLILCDQSQSQFFGSQQSFKSVRAAEAAALFAWTALKHNDRVGGIVFSDHGHHEIKPARNRKNVMRFLNLINDFNQALSIDMPAPDKDFNIDDALTECIRLSKPGTLIVIISDFSKLSAQSEKLLAKLAQHNELLMVHTFDPLEYELPINGIFPVSDGVETIVIDASKDSLKRNFENLIQKRQHELKRISTRLNAPLLELSTEFPAISSIQNLLFSLQR